jgi:hypothetical protein
VSVQILGETYANCVEQTSSHLFYAIVAAEYLLIFGANVSNAFAETPPLKQGLYIQPDRAFIEWWTQHKQQLPIPLDYIVPILSAMQGQPKLPRLWEKYTNAILRDLGLTPTVHEPCLYSGVIASQRIVFMQQVDNFAIAAPDKKTSDILLDLINEQVSIPFKRQGLLNMFNGINVFQMQHFIKIDYHTYTNKFCKKIPG